ncbi:MAG: Ig-like domain-containing protein [Candidatus Krumholzibacteriia bacterium]
MTRRIWVAAVVVLSAACAIPEPPPGGPEDTRAPEVSATLPRDGSAGVAVDTPIEITFDESMRKPRMERLLDLHPPVTIKKARWKGDALRLELEEPLHADTTYVVELRPGFSDAHGVANKSGFRFAFATSAAIDSGVIAGRVLFRRKPSDKGVVRLFVLPKDSAFSAEAARPEREAACAADGTFRFDYLPTSGEAFLLWAFQDQNGNLDYNREREAAAPGDTLSLSPEVPQREGISFYVVDPTEPASVTGTVDNRTGVDSVPVVVTMHERSDSLPPAYYVRCSADGSFDLEVLAGTYVLWSFLDFRDDSLCGTYPCADDSSRACREPCVMYPDTLRIEPGDKVRVGELLLEDANGG